MTVGKGAVCTWNKRWQSVWNGLLCIGSSFEVSRQIVGEVGGSGKVWLAEIVLFISEYGQ